MQNSSLLEYRMPTCPDLPMIDTVIVEVANPGHRFRSTRICEATSCPLPERLPTPSTGATGCA